MKRLILKFIFIIIIPLCVFPCSIFKYYINNKTYFGANEDWTAKDPIIMARQPKNSDYGYLIFGWKSFLPEYPQAGINTKGLCFDWAMVPKQNFTFDKTKQNASINIVYDIMKKCQNVDDVIKYFEKYNVEHLSEEHIMFADNSGKSCVIEYNNNKMKIITDKTNYQFITNFHITDKSLGGYPCERYNKIESFFKETGNKENKLSEVLDKAHQEAECPTIYSYIFDLNNLNITIYYNHNFKTKKNYSVLELVKRNSLIDIY